jgi:D-alanyl-D-alanine carboxypeptidase
MNKPFTTAALLTLALLLLAACGNSPTPAASQPPATPTPSANTSLPSAPASTKPSQTATPTSTPNQTAAPTSTPKASPSGTGKDEAIEVVAQPESITALVNKQFKLPEQYEPGDLVYPDVLFTFKEKIEKRMLRKEAAAALEKLFAGAKEDDILLAGVSAYRSHATQTTLFNRYVKQDGEEKAKTYSAVPGHSEHETGLAIDVSGSTGKCAAQDCFAGTKEAKWLDEHAAEYGFIIRYPNGKSAITGYQYEPWHLRYVGIKVAKEIHNKSLTMEEYYNAVPVSK